MHIVKDNAQFSTSLENFTKTLGELWKRDESWKPDFICICGDIINRGAIELFGDMESPDDIGYAGNAIREIANAAGLPYRYIMMVPGNHDFYKNDITDKQDYISQTIHWLANNATGIPVETRNALLPYSVFRKKFLVSNPKFIDRDLEGLNRSLQETFLPEELIDTTGCRVFEREKIIFIELNSAWCDLNNNLRYIIFNRLYIDRLFHKIQRYKQKGYYIVALFHHSLRYLNSDQYAETDRTNLYDQIVDMADLCLTGHDHGYRSKEPDKLANKCQHILNSGFFSVNNPSKVYDSGATLIKIERYNEVIYTLNLKREVNNLWQVDKFHKLYSTANQHIDPSMIGLGEKTNIPHRIMLKNEISVDRLYDLIITRLFGPCNYSELPIPEETQWIHFKISKDGSDSSVMILNAADHNDHPLPASLMADIEQDGLSIVIYLYEEDKEPSHSLGALKGLLRVSILQGKAAIIPIILKI